MGACARVPKHSTIPQFSNTAGKQFKAKTMTEGKHAEARKIVSQVVSDVKILDRQVCFSDKQTDEETHG